MIKGYKGSCHCGDVKVEVEGQPIRVVHCHCPTCRNVSGAGFITFVDYDLDKASFVGSTLKVYKSSKGVERQFCNKCGSTISYYGDKWPDEIDICLGIFDTPEVFTPEKHCYMKTALPWTHDMDNLPKDDTF